MLGGVAAWLWARRGVNDFIATLLLTLIMVQVVSWLANGPMEEPTGTLGQSSPVADSARWPLLLPRTTLRADILLVIVLVVLVAYVLRRTVVGYRLRLTGANPAAACATGTRTRLVGVAALCASAAAAGIAGSSLVIAAPAGNLAPGFSANYGFDGIVVALLARNSPLGCIPAALLLAALRQGGGLLEARGGDLERARDGHPGHGDPAGHRHGLVRGTAQVAAAPAGHRPIRPPRWRKESAREPVRRRAASPRPSDSRSRCCWRRWASWCRSAPA